MANFLYQQNLEEQAEPLYREAVAVCQANYAETHELTLTSLNNLGCLLMGDRKLEEAEGLFRRLIDEYTSEARGARARAHPAAPARPARSRRCAPCVRPVPGRRRRAGQVRCYSRSAKARQRSL